MLEEGVEEGGVLGWVGAGHHEEAAAVDGVGRRERVLVAAEVRMAVGLEDGPRVIRLAEAIEEAQRVARGDGLVELLDEDANVVGVDELVDEAAHDVRGLPAREGFARGRDVEDPAVGSQYVQQVAQLLEHALRPVPPLGELGQCAARGVHVGGAEAGR